MKTEKYEIKTIMSKVDMSTMWVGTGMIRKVYGNEVIVICDCIDCNNMAVWRQGFTTKSGVVTINVCEPHHYILRTKVPNNVSLDENVLKWLMVQGTNPCKIGQYGTLYNLKNVLMMEQLKNVELEFE